MALDGWDTLGQAVYGRNAKADEYAGGGYAKILYDAAALIDTLRAKLAKAEDEIARVSSPAPCNAPRCSVDG